MINYGYADFWSKGGITKFKEEASAYATLILVIYLASTLLTEYRIPARKRNNKNNWSAFAQKAAPSKKTIRYSAAAVLAASTIHFFSLNLDIVFENNTYLLIGSRDALQYQLAPLVMLHMASSLVGMLAIAILAVTIRTRDLISISIAAIPALWFLILKIGEHSRMSAVYAGVMTLIFLTSPNKKDRYILAFLSALMFFGNLANSLTGRGSGIHGLASIPNYFDNILSLQATDAAEIVLNIFEGAFTHGEIFFYTGTQYPLIFKILSLSPLPSAIDGYSESAHHLSIRFTEYVPFGATGEIFLFGPIFMAIYYLCVAISVQQAIKAYYANRYYAATTSLLLICLGSYLQYAYPTRNVFRFFLIAIAICIGSRIKIGKNQPKTTPTIERRKYRN